jgi:hypothetical protein
VAVPEKPDPASVAVIVVVPSPTGWAVARPSDPDALLIVAIFSSDELQVTVVVRSCVLLSVYVPVAVNCCVAVLEMLAVSGVMAIEASVAAVTVSPAVPWTDPSVAVIVTEPTPAPVANPYVPAALLIVATPRFDELQVTDAVRSCVLLSVYVPVAVNWFVVPVAMLGVGGVTAIEASVAAVTVSPAVPWTDPSVAVIVTEPTPAPVANPYVPAALLIVATPRFDELQVTDAVRSCVLLSV